MDLNIISDKDYSLLVAKYEKIEQLTKNIGEIIKLFNNYENNQIKVKNGENYLIDIKPESLKAIFQIFHYLIKKINLKSIIFIMKQF